MLIIDWILLALLLVGAIKGWRQGFLRQLISLGAFFVGLFVAKMCYSALGEIISPHLNDNTKMANILAFIAIWIVVPVALGLLGELFSAALGKLFVLGKVNCLLGALLGAIKYGLIMGSFIWVFATTGILNKDTMESSKLCTPLKAIPEAIYTALTNKNGGNE